MEIDNLGKEEERVHCAIIKQIMFLFFKYCIKNEGTIIGWTMIRAIWLDQHQSYHGLQSESIQFLI
jgi:hypothetical protein